MEKQIENTLNNITRNFNKITDFETDYYLYAEKFKKQSFQNQLFKDFKDFLDKIKEDVISVIPEIKNNSILYQHLDSYVCYIFKLKIYIDNYDAQLDWLNNYKDGVKANIEKSCNTSNRILNALYEVKTTSKKLISLEIHCMKKDINNILMYAKKLIDINPAVLEKLKESLYFAYIYSKKSLIKRYA